MQNGSKTKAVPVIGIERDTAFYAFKDRNGNRVSVPEEGILLTENLAGILAVHKGDQIKIKTYLPGREDAYVTVAGVVKQSLGINAYMNIAYMDELLLEKNTITGVYLDSTDQAIGDKLAKASIISTIQSPGDMRKLFDQYMGLTMYSLVIMIFFSGLMGFAIVYNATMISVGEREMEFSSLRVLGFSKGEIYRLVLKENNVITATGIILGIPVGIWMTEASSTLFTTELYSMNLMPTPGSGVMAALTTIAFVVLAQAATFRKISRLDFLQALKNRVS
jgi:putative ABC transport system permease protein